MPEPYVPDEIVSPLLLRCRAGRAAIVIVTHPGEKPPQNALLSVESIIRKEGVRLTRVRLSDLAPNPILRLVEIIAERGIDIFSIVCEPETILRDNGSIVNALNIHRNTYSSKNICAVFWIPQYRFHVFADRAANLLDYRTRLVEIGVDGKPLPSQFESPRFFVADPPPKKFNAEHAEDIRRIGELAEAYDRVAVIGKSYYGWPGGSGTLVRAYLHQNSERIIAEGGAFWIDARRKNWTDQILELADKMGAHGNSPEENLAGIADYLRQHPRAILIYDGVRVPQSVSRTLSGKLTPLTLGGRIIITTSREDISFQDFPLEQRMVVEDTGSKYEQDKLASDLPPGISIKHTLNVHPDSIVHMAWSPDGSILASASTDGVVRLWDSQGGHLLRTIPSMAESLAWSPDGTILAIGSVQSISFWDLFNKESDYTIEISAVGVFTTAWSPDSERLAVSYHNHPFIQILDSRTGELIQTLEGHSESVSSLIWSPNSDFIVSASLENTIRLWDSSSGACTKILKGHTGSILSIALESHSLRLASASVDRTVRLWDLHTGRQERILEDHVGIVRGISFSTDGRLLASSSLDGSLILWRCDTWQGTKIPVEPHDRILTPGLAFHPESPVLACSSQKGRVINLYEIDLAYFGGVQVTIFGDLQRIVTVGSTVSSHWKSFETISYANARAVLVGDSGVGKSGLALVLTGKDFAPTDSSQGRHVWMFDHREVEIEGGQVEKREIFLWDLAGQPGYRLVNQLHLDEVALALVVFDAKNETDPFEGVRYWDRALRQAQRSNPGQPMKKFLVAARLDRFGIPVSRDRIDAVVRDLGFAGYFETSAREGRGISALKEAIRQAVDWDSQVRISSPRLFHRIYDYLMKEKNTGRVLAIGSDLYRGFIATEETQDKDLQDEFETCMISLETHGLIRRLSFGNLVLLQPELLDSYASAMINGARENPDGLGFILEDDARNGRFHIPSDGRLPDRESKKLLLLATIEDLIRHELALREHTADGPCLVFPSQVTLEYPNMPEPEERAVIFTFDGPVMNIYTTLAVRLARSSFFVKKKLWRNAVIYSSISGGECGMFLRELQEGRGQLTLFFDENASKETRLLFERYIRLHLHQRALPESIERQTIEQCPKCGEIISDRTIKRRLRMGHQDIRCPACDDIFVLMSPSEAEETSVAQHLIRMNEKANAMGQKETYASILQGKIETDDFDVFLCHNSEDKAAVKDVGQRLKEKGILPWLDEWELRPGLPWQRSLEEQIEKIKSAAVFVGKNGIGPWQHLELDAFLRAFASRGCPVIPALLPDAPSQPELPVFLKGMTWVDFRKNEPDPMKQLIWGITGKKDISDYLLG